MRAFLGTGLIGRTLKSSGACVFPSATMGTGLDIVAAMDTDCDGKF